MLSLGAAGAGSAAAAAIAGSPASSADRGPLRVAVSGFSRDGDTASSEHDAIAARVKALGAVVIETAGGDAGSGAPGAARVVVAKAVSTKRAILCAVNSGAAPVVDERWVAACEAAGRVSVPKAGQYAPVALSPLLAGVFPDGYSLAAALRARAGAGASGGVFAGRTVYLLLPSSKDRLAADDLAAAIAAGGGDPVVVNGRTDLAALAEALSAATRAAPAAPTAFAVWTGKLGGGGGGGGGGGLSSEATRLLDAGAPVWATSAITHASLEQVRGLAASSAHIMLLPSEFSPPFRRGWTC